jgi:hypothetical protein
MRTPAVEATLCESGYPRSVARLDDDPFNERPVPSRSVISAGLGLGAPTRPICTLRVLHSLASGDVHIGSWPQAVAIEASTRRAGPGSGPRGVENPDGDGCEGAASRTDGEPPQQRARLSDVHRGMEGDPVSRPLACAAAVAALMLAGCGTRGGPGSAPGRVPAVGRRRRGASLAGCSWRAARYAPADRSPGPAQSAAS